METSKTTQRVTGENIFKDNVPKNRKILEYLKHKYYKLPIGAAELCYVKVFGAKLYLVTILIVGDKPKTVSRAYVDEVQARDFIENVRRNKIKF